MTGRASSYHSYSQSPPYDYQYEERHHGKQAFALIRKASSDRGLKSSGSFSPSHLANPVNEENFADEHSNFRSSDYSTSSASSPHRSNNQSPSTQRGIRFSSSFSETSKERVNMWNQKVNTFPDKSTNLDEGRAPHPQRTASNSSFASSSSSSMAFNSVNSENDSGTKKVSGTQYKSTTLLPLPTSSVSRNHDSPELFSTVFASQTVTSSTSESDFFQSPKMSSNLPTDLFQPSSMSLISTASCPELSLASQPLSSGQKSSTETLNETSSDLVNQQNGKWATFDGPQIVEPSQGSQSFTGAAITFNEGGLVSDTDQHLFQNTTQEWNAFYDYSAQVTYPSMPTLPLPSSSVSRNHDIPEPFNTVFASQTVTSCTSDSDSFQSPEMSSNLPIDLFQPSSMSLISTASCPELSLASQPLSEGQKPSTETLNETSSNLINQQNGRWATSDGPQNMEPSQGSQSFTGAAITFNEGGSVSDTDQHLFQNTTQQWNAFYDYSAQVTYPSMPIHWHGSQNNSVTLPSGSHQAGALLSTANRISTNPFDIAYESDVELSNMFVGMSPMQGVLPNSQMPTAFNDGVTDPWFTQNSVATYIPIGPQGTFGLFGRPVPNTQIASVPSKGSVAPVGGNPFA